MLCLWNADVQDKIFYLVFKLNKHAKICERSISTGVFCETGRLFIGDTTIGPLGNVDDLASINRTENNVTGSHDSARHFQHKRRLQLSVKC